MTDKGNPLNKLPDIKKKFEKFTNNIDQTYFIKTLSILFIIIILISIIYYIYYKLTLDQRNCNYINSIYQNTPPLTSITNDNNSNTYRLRDFYVKSAYNCCSPGNFKNDFVNLCSLLVCLKQGVRFLDFEIYSINNQPVVATSSVLDYSIKETYNYISINDVLNFINNNAFSGGICPNYNDPIILHFRIMSNNCKMYNNFAKIIVNNSIFNSRTLGKNYSYEFSNDSELALNIGAIPIIAFQNKIIISVDASNPLYQDTDLHEFINITSNSMFLHLYRYSDVLYTQDLTISDYNKKNMSIVLPDVQANNYNPDFNISKTYGCQFIAMSYQNFDTNLELYNEFFDSNRSAFVLKPKNLRYIPVTIEEPPPQDSTLSYAPQTVETIGPTETI
jgi:hypothetical protein